MVLPAMPLPGEMQYVTVLLHSVQPHTGTLIPTCYCYSFQVVLGPLYVVIHLQYIRDYTSSFTHH